MLRSLAYRQKSVSFMFPSNVSDRCYLISVCSAEGDLQAATIDTLKVSSTNVKQFLFNPVLNNTSVLGWD